MSFDRKVGGTAPLMGVGLGLGVSGLGLVVLGFQSDPRQAALSYLAAYFFASSISLGALSLLMVGHVTGARWLVAVRRPVEGVAAILPVYAVLFVPIALMLPTLYPWASLTGLEPHAAELLEKKRSFLNPAAFLARAAVYLFVWSALAVTLWRRSVRHDASAAPVPDSEPQRARGGRAPRLSPSRSRSRPSIGSCRSSRRGSRRSTEFIVSPTPSGRPSRSRSSSRRSGRPAVSCRPRSGRLTSTRSGDCSSPWSFSGRTWHFRKASSSGSATFRASPAWYVTRTNGAWAYVLAFLGIGGFALPFFVLLSRDLKTRPKALAIVASWLLAVHYVDVYWLVLPALHADGPRPHWLDAAALGGVGGIALAATAFVLRGVATVPRGAPGLAASLRYSSV